MSQPLSTNRTILLVLASLLLVAVLWVAVKIGQDQYDWNKAKYDLELIYDALDRYEHRNGSLPILALYPSDPLTGEDSIRFMLARYVIDSGVFVSPVGHPKLQGTGLTYIWNPNLNRRRLGTFDPPVWVLTDIQALDATVRSAHRNGYATLFTDGSVRKLEDSPFRLSSIQ